MLLHHELLDQARALAKLDRKRPRQGNLRRAVSSAYYALFHLLIHEASRRLAGQPAPGVAAEVNHGVRRWFDHKTMRHAAGWFLGMSTPPSLNSLFSSAQPASARVLSTLASAPLKAVASAFVALQEQRHLADYDLGVARFTRQQTLRMVQRAEQAFENWKQAQNDPLLPLFLLLLLTGDKVVSRR